MTIILWIPSTHNGLIWKFSSSPALLSYQYIGGIYSPTAFVPYITVVCLDPRVPRSEPFAKIGPPHMMDCDPPFSLWVVNGWSVSSEFIICLSSSSPMVILDIMPSGNVIGLSISRPLSIRFLLLHVYQLFTFVNVVQLLRMLYCCNTPPGVILSYQSSQIRCQSQLSQNPLCSVPII